MKTMPFKIGDSVETLDDEIQGVITHISSDTVTVEDEDGFNYQFQARELMLLPESNIIVQDLNRTNLDNVKQLKANSDKKPRQAEKRKSKQIPAQSIDLHIHKVVDSTKGMTNFDMLNAQLDTAKWQLERAIKTRQPKIVFIHGVGEGVLKMELHTLLRRYEQITFYDADFKTYGFGATEVKIFQNP